MWNKCGCNKMGINSEFKYGIGLYDFSFSFSNLKVEETFGVEDSKRGDMGFRFLADISKELFNSRAGIKKPRKSKVQWVLTCL